MTLHATTLQSQEAVAFVTVVCPAFTEKQLMFAVGARTPMGACNQWAAMSP